MYNISSILIYHEIKEMDLSNHQGRKINDDSDIAVLDIGQPVSKIYHSLCKPRTYQYIHSICQWQLFLYHKFLYGFIYEVVFHLLLIHYFSCFLAFFNILV